MVEEKWDPDVKNREKLNNAREVAKSGEGPQSVEIEGRSYEVDSDGYGTIVKEKSSGSNNSRQGR
jgi:hypothetical protein